MLGPVAIFRDEYGKAALFLQEALPARSDPSEILELEGTLPIQEARKQAFFAGTLELFLDGGEAVNFLERAERIRPTAEGANNLGLAKYRVSESTRAKNQFQLAVSRWEGYLDALINSETSESPGQFTTHQIRM